MTAINIIRKRDAVYIVTDGAAYDEKLAAGQTQLGGPCYEQA